MIEYPPHVNEVVRTPKWPIPAFVAENIVHLADTQGFLDVCDGVTTLGITQITTPQEDEALGNLYIADLQSEAGQPALSDSLSDTIALKLACDMLTAREHGVLAVNFPEQAGLQRQALSRLKATPSLALQAMRAARQYGYVSLDLQSTRASEGEPYQTTVTVAREGKLFTGIAKAPEKAEASGQAACNALAHLLGIDTESLPAYEQTVFAPKAALRQHLEMYGGPGISPYKNGQAVREFIRKRHAIEYKDQIFYPDPKAALSAAYGDVELFWGDHEDARSSVCTTVQLERKGENGVDTYVMNARGPNKYAARQAAARIILRHIGATNPDIMP